MSYFLLGSFFWVFLLCLGVVKPRKINFFIYISFPMEDLRSPSRKSWHQFEKELLHATICIPIDFVEMTLQQPEKIL